MCAGHEELNNKLQNVKIISAKELRYREINNVDIVIVDEAQRLYTESLEKIERWVKRTKTICIFSYDAGQMLSRREKFRDTTKKINVICTNHIFKLTNKIRTTKNWHCLSPAFLIYRSIGMITLSQMPKLFLNLIE